MHASPLPRREFQLCGSPDAELVVRAYTNAGLSRFEVIFVDRIGRQGHGAEAWSNYWFTATDKLQLHFRHQKG